MKDIKIFCDGGSRGNPGLSSCAFVVFENGEKVFEKYFALGMATNNIAEYSALVKAYEWLKNERVKCLGECYVKFYLDSMLVVSQVTGVYKIKNNNLKNLFFKIKEYEKTFKNKPEYFFITRDKNKRADYLVNYALNNNSNIK